MNGTGINNGNVEHRAIVESCNGCDRILAGGADKTCSAFAFPDTKWRLGPCSMATHIKVETGKAGEKQRVGQQKQKKR